MQLGDAVDSKAADHTQIRHPHLFIMMYRQFGPHLVITWPLFVHQLFKLRIDLLDDDKWRGNKLRTSFSSQHSRASGINV